MRKTLVCSLYSVGTPSKCPSSLTQTTFPDGTTREKSLGGTAKSASLDPISVWDASVFKSNTLMHPFFCGRVDASARDIPRRVPKSILKKVEWATAATKPPFSLAVDTRPSRESTIRPRTYTHNAHDTGSTDYQ